MSSGCGDEGRGCRDYLFLCCFAASGKCKGERIEVRHFFFNAIVETIPSVYSFFFFGFAGCERNVKEGYHCEREKRVDIKLFF